jgi:hypothetical protein
VKGIPEQPWEFREICDQIDGGLYVGASVRLGDQLSVYLCLLPQSSGILTPESRICLIAWNDHYENVSVNHLVVQSQLGVFHINGALAGEMSVPSGFQAGRPDRGLARRSWSVTAQEFSASDQCVCRVRAVLKRITFFDDLICTVQTGTRP